MIDINSLKEFVERKLEGTPYFPVEIKVTPANEITIEIDSRQSVDIDFCISLSRAIEEAFPREPEDYELEVGSAGITSPFKVKAQYDKYVGQEVETLTRDGRLLRGLLRSAGDNGFVLTVETKEKPEGSKKPILVKRDIELGYGDVKHTKYLLKF